jgi:hypothetical protein
MADNVGEAKRTAPAAGAAKAGTQAPPRELVAPAIDAVKDVAAKASAMEAKGQQPFGPNGEGWNRAATLLSNPAPDFRPFQLEHSVAKDVLARLSKDVRNAKEPRVMHPPTMKEQAIETAFAVPFVFGKAKRAAEVIYLPRANTADLYIRVGKELYAMGTVQESK